MAAVKKALDEMALAAGTKQTLSNLYFILISMVWKLLSAEKIILDACCSPTKISTEMILEVLSDKIIYLNQEHMLATQCLEEEEVTRTLEHIGTH
jgi:hypothetical protein